jgi:hypothetical protein
VFALLFVGSSLSFVEDFVLLFVGASLSTKDKEDPTNRRAKT